METEKFCAVCGDLLDYDDKQQPPKWSHEEREFVCFWCGVNETNPQYN